MGGIVAVNNGIINNCINNATVTERNSSGYVGGITAYCYADGNIINCKNYGAISSTTSNIGGIVGQSSGTIANCENFGDVTDTEINVGIGISNIGGIAGISNGTVTNCKNSGKISGDLFVGGIIGENISNYIKNCENSGAINGNLTGGIAGYITNGALVNCINSSSVSGGSGIVGEIADDSSVEITNCGWRTDVPDAPENGIGAGGENYNTIGFDSTLADKVITTLTASIMSSSITLNETTTITLRPAPGTPKYAFNNETGAVRAIGHISSVPNIVNITDNGNGEFSVTGNTIGSTIITITADVHPYVFEKDSYSDVPEDVSKCKFVFNVNVASNPQPESNGTSATTYTGGGGGCSTGFGALALLALVPLFAMKRRK